MKCPACQTDNRDRAKFCDECGSRLPSIAQTSPVNYSEPQSYTPKFLTEKILTTRSAVEGERKVVTVLFADVAGYTAIAEQLDPEDVHQLMDGCFQILMDKIHAHEGTINQFTGDGVMALFGAPLAHEDHAQRACAAALEIQDASASYGRRIRGEHGFDFKLRLGLNSGPVVVGAIGDDLRMDYTAIGDTANLAARLQSFAKPGAILVSETTCRLVRPYFAFESEGDLVLKGKKEPQPAYRLIGKTEVETRIEASSVFGLKRFVGRQPELTLLGELFQQARGGQFQMVGIVGEAGSGKSRLLLEFRGRLGGTGVTCLTGSCLHHGSAVPYMPILDILRDHFGFQADDSQATRQGKLQDKVWQLGEGVRPDLSPLQELLSLPVGDQKYSQIDPEQRKLKIFEALRDLLVAHSRTSPTILILEDLHWIDRDSEQVLNYLADNLSKANVLLALLYRQEYSHPWGNKAHYTEIGMEPLTSHQGEELIAGLLSDGEVPPEISQLILGTAGGNPLFVEEVTQGLLESGGIEKHDSRYHLTADRDSIQIPDTIQGIIAARIDRLEEGLKKTLQSASVIGREFPVRVLQAVESGEPGLLGHLKGLQRFGLLLESQQTPEPVYRFKHALTRDVAYDGLLQKQRRELHERIGHAIEALYPERLHDHLELLAYHFNRSERADKAAEYLDRANEKAIQIHAYEQAMHYFEALMKRLGALPDSTRKRNALVSAVLRQARPFFVLLQGKRYYAMLERYAPEIHSLEDDRATLTYLTWKGRCEWWCGKYVKGLETATQALTLSGVSGKTFFLPSIYQVLEWIHLCTGNLKQVCDYKDRAVSILIEEGFDLYNYCYCLMIASWAHSWMGQWNQAVESAQKALEAGQQYGDFSLKCYAAWVISIAYNRKGDVKRAVAYGELAAHSARTPVDKVTAQGFLAWARCAAGSPEGAIEPLAEIIPMMRAAAFRMAEVGYTGCLGDAYWAAGQYHKATETFESGLRLAEDSKMRYWVGWYSRALGEIALQTESPGARTHLERGIEILREIRAENELALATAAYGRLHWQEGNVARARKFLEAALATLDRLGTLREPDRIRADLVRLPSG